MVHRNVVLERSLSSRSSSCGSASRLPPMQRHELLGILPRLSDSSCWSAHCKGLMVPPYLLGPWHRPSRSFLCALLHLLIHSSTLTCLWIYSSLQHLFLFSSLKQCATLICFFNLGGHLVMPCWNFLCSGHFSSDTHWRMLIIT